MIKRQVYTENIPLADALRRWTEELTAQGNLAPVSGEAVAVEHSLGRITAAAVVARTSSPAYSSSAMDGIAVRTVKTVGASETSPKRLKIGEDAVFVDTGDPLPQGMDAVIMIEDLDRCAKNEVEITAAAAPYQHVRTLGEDIVATELILPENHKIRPVDIGAMLAGGVSEVEVRRLPVVKVIPTGDELVQPGAEVEAGNIVEFNSRILCNMVREWGGKAIRGEIIPDRMDALKESVLQALDEADLVVVNAGSSAGKQDYTVHVLRELGKVFLHGVSIRPGKPVILGTVRGKPVLGIPGYPVSAVLTFELFVKPVIFSMQGLPEPEPETVKAMLSRQVASPLGQEEFLRVKVGVVGDRLIATPVSRGAGMLMSLVRADGIVRIPALNEGIASREYVHVQLIRSRREIEQTVVCIGSHDNSLDVLATLLKRQNPELSLSSAHVGSLGGLLAIKRGEAHLAGTHLLDEETGDYNVPFVRRLLAEKETVLVNLAYRVQGLVVPKGNPKGIRGIEDLGRKDVVFVNRQRGSGTRLLLDKHLGELDMDPAAILGYEREEYTHMGVASAVAGGTADTGLGILAAAKALSLDFIPVARERYDFAIPVESLETEKVQRLLTLLREDEEFRKILLGLGGYDLADTGTVIYDSRKGSALRNNPVLKDQGEE